jgi:hypothetical protein
MYDEGDTSWSGWWVALWVACILALVGLEVLGVSPLTWGTWFLGLFLLPELIGLRRHRDALPPLTFVTRRYVPRWVPTAVTFACGAWLAASWWQRAVHPMLAVIVVAGFVGWLTNHWDVTYDV